MDFRVLLGSRTSEGLILLDSCFFRSRFLPIYCRTRVHQVHSFTSCSALHSVRKKTFYEIFQDNRRFSALDQQFLQPFEAFRIGLLIPNQLDKRNQGRRIEEMRDNEPSRTKVREYIG